MKNLVEKSVFVFLCVASVAVIIFLSYKSFALQSLFAPTAVLGAETEIVVPTAVPTITTDERVTRLETFMNKHDSPLATYAARIVHHADVNNIDYRLIPAIAMVESTLCKNIYAGSHNCWGWGIYGGKVTRFADYEDAIDTISRGFRKFYYDKGMTSPSAIMKVYNPVSNGEWAEKVEWAYRRIDE